jgi:hypothetical protein
MLDGACAGCREKNRILVWYHLIICSIALLAAVTVVLLNGETSVLVGACASGSFR